MAKCFGKLTYSMGAQVDRLEFNFRILQRATEYGVDSFSTPQILAFAVELKEAGILTDVDFAGCPTDKEGRFFWLLDRLSSSGRNWRYSSGRRLLCGTKDRQGCRGI